MNAIIAFSAAMLLVACQVQGRPQNAPAFAQSVQTTKNVGNVTLVKNENTPLDGKGSFSYDIELSDGTKLAQSGHTEAPAMGETEPSIVIEGSYAYVAPDGKQISITYVADKNGFQPKGDAIPTQGTASNTSRGTAVSSGNTFEQTRAASVAAPAPAQPAPAQPAPVPSVDTPAQSSTN